MLASVTGTPTMQGERHRLPKSSIPEESIHASYFFAFHDHELVGEIYRRLLKREPDPGSGSYLALIRAGESRYRILDDISRSSEAKAVGVKLLGMASYRRTKFLQRVPVLGHFASAISLLLRARPLMRDLRALENHVFRLSKNMDAE